MRNLPLHAFLLATACAGEVAAQVTSYVAPFGCQSNDGSAANTIPWWSGSATYQQVHNANDLAWVFPSAVGIIKGLSFRADYQYPLVGRMLDAQITLGSTPVTAATATTVFATNLGANPMVTLQYTTINLPSVVNLPTVNPQSWFFPFAVPFIYIISSGNLCWELRIKNSNSSAVSYSDAVASAPGVPTFMPLIGAGCVATGRAQPATIGARSLPITGAFSSRLDQAAGTAPAAMVFGTVAQPLTLPGLCSTLQTIPDLSVSGTTDSVGSWTVNLQLGNLGGYPRATIYTQFAFADAGLAYGFGLSDCSPVVLPGASTYGITRIWATVQNSGQGNETATSGTLGTNYGLVTGFDF